MSEPDTPNAASAVVVGGGLAGSEAAWQLAERGIQVVLYEMRPAATGAAHQTDRLAELVCSNSFKSREHSSATGQLKRELVTLGSLLMSVAEETAVPAGSALAVDREAFAQRVTERIEHHPDIIVLRQEATSIPTDIHTIVATGPLTSASLQSVLSGLIGKERLAFFDAAAPIVDAEAIDMSAVFAASRYGKGGTADYLNIPLSREQYERFVSDLVAAERVTAKDFETADLFQACQPIEEVARKGADALRFGPLKPVGLTDPQTGERPWAVVQLRAENMPRTAYNLVGFQTNLTYAAQKQVFRRLPGLGDVEFLRFGVMHRNTFVDAPRLLDATLALHSHPKIRLAGQVTGTEGYSEAVGTGLLAALNTASAISDGRRIVLPRTTALGSLVAYATNPHTGPYQPMHVNWGLVSPLPEKVRNRRSRYERYAARAQQDLEDYLQDAACPIGPEKRHA
ncbi:MAG: methylenetetrahydrofolate--tRNA-(uracil(54)-C(5))-methyltransferase (FADH(2)-oxidizing) TrmFO [Coriobacteriia bacterium]|nr:methylenetetrahydrofolate--tRNA-(uracil(54)-C(5))-methyltransferase (FADH(2)-oxidizing) TrmFO [Coriobacteriia bacterium]